MTNPEQNIISGKLELDTPEGSISLSFSIAVEAGLDIARTYFKNLSSGSELLKVTMRPPVLEGKRHPLSPQQIHNWRRRKIYNSIATLIPPEDILEGLTTRALVVLKGQDITDMETLASLTDEEISNSHLEWRNCGLKTAQYIKYLRSLAQKHLEETIAQDQS